MQLPVFTPSLRERQLRRRRRWWSMLSTLYSGVSGSHHGTDAGTALGLAGGNVPAGDSALATGRPPRTWTCVAQRRWWSWGSHFAASAYSVYTVYSVIQYLGRSLLPCPLLQERPCSWPVLRCPQSWDASGDGDGGSASSGGGNELGRVTPARRMAFGRPSPGVTPVPAPTVVAHLMWSRSRHRWYEQGGEATAAAAFLRTVTHG